MRFWQGIFWASFIVILLSFVMKPMIRRSQHKPLVERSAEAVFSTMHDLMRQAYKRLVQRID